MKKLLIEAIILILVSINIFSENKDSILLDLDFPDYKKLTEPQKFIEKIAPFDAKPADLIDRYGMPEKVSEESVYGILPNASEDAILAHYHFENIGEFSFFKDSKKEFLVTWTIDKAGIENLNIPINRMEVFEQFGDPRRDFGDRVLYIYGPSELYIYFNEDETLRKIFWSF